MIRIVLFDDYCHLCNTTVNFIIKHDINNLYTLMSLQSKEGQLYLRKYSLPLDDFDTVILIENDKAYVASTAALMIIKNLSGAVKYLNVLIVIPQRIRDFIYNLISKNRYALFCKSQTCKTPTIKNNLK